MLVHVVERFAPKPQKEKRLRDELLRFLPPSRAVSGCEGVFLFESTRRAPEFLVHSLWNDEPACDQHYGSTQMRCFLERIDELLFERVEVIRARQIA